MKKSELKQIIKEEIMKNNEFKRMQKLAGIKKLNENETSYEQFQNSDEMGWMEVTMEEIAQEEDWDLKYRGDFDKVFEKALNKLKKEHPELNFDLIIKYKENMF